MENFQFQVPEPVYANGTSFNPKEQTFSIREEELFAQTNVVGLAGNKYGWIVVVEAYQRHLPVEKHEVGKRKQRIERKHLRLRTRIKRLTRKTICFSKSEEMHDLVIGLFINRYEFGLNI